MAAIRRPTGEIVAPGVMGQLYELPRCNIHQINVLPSRSTGTIMPDPREGQRHAVWGPCRRDSIPLLCNLLHVAAVRVHEEDLRQSGASADPGNLGIGLR